ncbi:hypothetical protein GUJ93_ZPchr0010g10622 [Zizania palustris]|uniref:Uncharacterized protein n=1 Tax=Zizania palustris TaxID=103762 RepID=A0A8J5W9P7_ZIZPA|nr:hypothetical protein GUJ93_ZPchr0010g10622 [Zizania palustris]
MGSSYATPTYYPCLVRLRGGLAMGWSIEASRRRWVPLTSFHQVSYSANRRGAKLLFEVCRQFLRIIRRWVINNAKLSDQNLQSQ